MLNGQRRRAIVIALWQGLSVGDLCRMLKNPKLNGNRTPEALVEHMESEPLVLWSWNPGRGRAAVPMPHGAFVNLIESLDSGRHLSAPNEECPWLH